MNSPTEDDTFNRLKSITREEAEAEYLKVYLELAMQHHGADDAGVPVTELREILDQRLLPYGWSFDRLFPPASRDVS
jgi:hypothetical protein